MNTLQISGTYNPQKQYKAIINVERAGKLTKVIELKTQFKGASHNEKAIYLFFILGENATHPLPNQFWENGKLTIEGTLQNEPDNKHIAAIVIYDEDKNRDLYDELFESDVKKFIRMHVGKPKTFLLAENNYIDHLHFQKIVRTSIKRSKLMMISAFGMMELDYGVPPARVGNGGVLKPGS